MKAERRKRRMKLALVLAALAALALLLFSGCGSKKSSGELVDELANRNKPRAGQPSGVDMSVINQGNSLWQNQAYRTAAEQALAGVNAQRQANGMAPLRWDDNLAACGMIRAAELPSSFSHTRPNGQDWYTVCPPLMYGENLAKGYSSPDSAVQAWMNSPTHKQNILTAGFVSCGIGVYESGGTWYWGQEFGYY